MKTIIKKITSLFKTESFIDYKALQKTFINRQELTVRVTFWLSLSLNFIFLIINWYLNLTPIPIQTFNILCSSIPCYYFLKTNQYQYAKFFVYFPAIVFQAIAAYILLLANYPHGNAELALVPYVVVPIVIYKKSLSIVGVLLNIFMFIFIEIKKYYLFPISFFELNLNLFMSFTAYLVLIIAAYFYKIDFMRLKANNDKLNAQKLIIETQAEELKAINSTKNRLFSIIAHDLRSPLSSLKWAMELIDNEIISKEEFKELSKRLQSSVDNVHGMLDNLLLWSLSQMEGIKPNLAPFDLNFIIDETILTFKENAMQKQVNLTNNSVTNLQALGDEYQIKTVLRNLFYNAIKFTPSHGQIAIDSSIKGQFVHLKITDSGVGIEKNDLVQIFSNPKLKTGTAGEKGTGFGLFLCKELIDKNGGGIEIDSEFGKGTTVEILLPLVVN